MRTPKRLLAIGLLTLPLLLSADKTVKVNVDNFVRAETALQFDRSLKYVKGKVNTFIHIRVPQPLDKQSVIRMNRDTLYSSAIIDISKGATLTIPQTHGRYLTAMVVNENHYINKVYSKPGTYKLTMREFDTPYVNVSLRILADAGDPADIKKANAIQDGVIIKANSAKPYTHPNYDMASYKTTYDALLVLGKGMTDTRATFGKNDKVDEVRHLLGTAWGWGGLPEKEAYYLNVEPKLPVGAYKLTVRNVPVDAFWSISLYNKDGYFQKNKYNAYSVNNITAKPNKDGSITIHFGGDPKSANYLPLTEGWNYTVRLYKPHQEVIDGTWKFPKIQKVK